MAVLAAANVGNTMHVSTFVNRWGCDPKEQEVSFDLAAAVRPQTTELLPSSSLRSSNAIGWRRFIGAYFLFLVSVLPVSVKAPDYVGAV